MVTDSNRVKGHFTTTVAAAAVSSHRRRRRRRRRRRPNVPFILLLSIEKGE